MILIPRDVSSLKLDTSTCFQSFSGEKQITGNSGASTINLFTAANQANAGKYLASAINLFTSLNKTNVLTQSYKLVIESKVCIQCAPLRTFKILADLEKITINLFTIVNDDSAL